MKHATHAGICVQYITLKLERSVVQEEPACFTTPSNFWSICVYALVSEHLGKFNAGTMLRLFFFFWFLGQYSTVKPEHY
jgi:hypothetical protein